MDQTLLAQLAELSPIPALVVIAGVCATALTQLAKQPGWTKARVQRVALGISVVLGALAYVLSGAAALPETFVQAVATLVLVVAGVAIASRAAYSLLGHAIPDGTAPVLEARPRGDGTFEVDLAEPSQPAAADDDPPTHRAGD